MPTLLPTRDGSIPRLGSGSDFSTEPRLGIVQVRLLTQANVLKFFEKTYKNKKLAIKFEKKNFGATLAILRHCGAFSPLFGSFEKLLAIKPWARPIPIANKWFFLDHLIDFGTAKLVGRRILNESQLIKTS